MDQCEVLWDGKTIEFPVDEIVTALWRFYITLDRDSSVLLTILGKNKLFLVVFTYDCKTRIKN